MDEVDSNTVVSAVVARIKYVAKAVVAVVVPAVWEALTAAVEALQGTFADDPWVTVVLGAVAVFLVKNGPKP